MGKNIKEVFIASVAQRLDIHYNGPDMPADDWFKEYYNEICEYVDEIGLDIEYMVDMEIVSDTHIQIFLLTGSHLEVGDEKDFRGYVIPKGDTIIPALDVISSLRESNSFGEYGFEDGEYFEIIEVRHDDICNRIEYYLKCFVEAVIPRDINIG